MDFSGQNTNIYRKERMNNIKFSATPWLQNAFLFIFGLIFTLAIGEWLFPKFLNKIPFRLYGGVENNLRVLAQYSKNSVIPENYLAILGDSNSVGLGDLYMDLTQNSKKWYPDYAPAHFINKKVGLDVISFGFSGAGSFDGIWSGPINQLNLVNSRKEFDLPPPKTILIIFYEGNDIADILKFIAENYRGNKNITELVSFIKFNKWLNHQFQESVDENRSGFETNLIFTKFLIKSVKNVFLEFIKKSNKGNERHFRNHRFIFPAVPLTQAIINGNTVPLPMHLQAPPLFNSEIQAVRRVISEESKNIWIKLNRAGYYIFESAVKKLSRKFPDSDIKIIYLPSVLSTYKIISPRASFLSNMGDGGLFDLKKLLRGGIVDTHILFQRHLEVCREIQKISENLKTPFFDTTNYLRDASSKGYIHGPKDWDHLNESGYRALSDGISQFILHPDKSYQNCTN